MREEILPTPNQNVNPGSKANGPRLYDPDAPPRPPRRISPIPPKAVDAIVKSAVRTERGITPDRFRPVFALARRLHRVGFAPGPAELLRVVKEWDRVSRHHAHASSFPALADMLGEALGKLEQTADEAFPKLLAEAVVMDPPAFARGYKPKLALLASLCIALARHAGEEAFPLSQRQVMEAVGASGGDTQRMMKTLQRDGIIVEVTKGKRGLNSREATTWRFIGVE